METQYNILADCRGMYESEIIEKIYEVREIDNPKHFYHPTENDMLPLDTITNIHIAYETVRDAIDYGQNILVHWDCDMDGVSSGAIMTRYLQNYLDQNHLHTMINEGKQHGLSPVDIAELKDFDVVIIVDSLDVDVSKYQYLYNQGVKVIILDHHAISTEIPYDEYVILVSSQRDYDNPNLSGAGVVWKFCKYIDSQLGQSFADELVDLAACGIVGDAMDMSNMENRYIVSKGLEQIYNPVIKKIVGNYAWNSTAISFSIAPIVNAANRMMNNQTVMRAFLADDKKEVTAFVKELKNCREKQNDVVNDIMSDIIKQCEQQLDKKMMVVLYDTDFGVSGLIGNKLINLYQRPVLILKETDTQYVGSMRAVGTEDFRAICNNSGLVEANGHELASGIFIPKENLNPFIEYIEDNFEITLKETVDVDVLLNIEDITRSLVDNIKFIDKVSGQNSKPIRVMISNLKDYDIGQMSDYKHLVMKPSDYLWLIKWNYNKSFEDMEDHSLMNDTVTAVGTLDSGWFGRKFVLKFICDDFEVS